MTNPADQSAEELNRRVAEALGYFPDRHSRTLPQDLHLEWRIFDKRGVGQTEFCESPEAAWVKLLATRNYAADLNAIAEARRTLTEEQRKKYGEAIWEVVLPGWKHNTNYAAWDIADATPEMHCRALLAALNK